MEWLIIRYLLGHVRKILHYIGPSLCHHQTIAANQKAICTIFVLKNYDQPITADTPTRCHNMAHRIVQSNRSLTDLEHACA